MIVVYDGECRVCSASVRWLERRLGDRLEALPYQRAGVVERFGLTLAQAEAAVWSVGPEGRRDRGALAINRLLREVGGPWAWVARFLGLPGIRWAEEIGYRWFSAHRHWFGRFFGLPTCHAGDPC